MLAALGFVAVLAAQPSVAVRSPYLEAVRRYGPGTEAEAIAALRAIRLRDADQVFEELDGRICAAVGARGCMPQRLVDASRESQKKVAVTWRRLYPRALALHVEALAACDPSEDGAAIQLHLNVLLKLVVRIEQIAREQPDVPREFAQLATQGRHLTLWALQFLRSVEGLAAALEVFDVPKIRGDVDVRLARGALEELLALPDVIARSPRARDMSYTFARDNLLANLQQRQLEKASRVYEALLADDQTVLEAHLRLARLQIRLGQITRAEEHLVRVANLRPDGRQAYLTALFLADVYERQQLVTDAIAAYGVAQENWPPAQSPGIGIARLRALSGAHQDARKALAVMLLERPADAPKRSDPWMGYLGAQAWRLPSAIAALQATFEAEP